MVFSFSSNLFDKIVFIMGTDWRISSHHTKHKFFCFWCTKKIAKNAASEVDIFGIRYFFKTKQTIGKKKFRDMFVY